MMIELYRDFIRHLAKRAKVSASVPGKDSLDALRKYSDSLPVDFYSVMTTCWPADVTPAGPYELYSLEDILGDRRFEALFSKGFFLIGHALNGDFLTIRTGRKWGSETSVHLVSHEHLLSYEMHPDECAIEIAAELLEFFYRAVEERYMPMDFFCAQEVAKLRQKYGPEKPPAGA